MTDAEAVVASRFAEADLAAGRFINVLDGEKGTRDHDTRYSDPRDAPGTNYGIYPGEGLVYLDVDDYGEAVDDTGLAAVRDLPETLRTESPHTDGEPGGHRFYHVTGEAVGALESTFGTANPQPSWGEVRAKNQYVVGPGSQLDGCDKEWCEACATPDGGRYVIATDAPIATITAETLVDTLRKDPDLSRATDGGVAATTAGSADNGPNNPGGTAADYDPAGTAFETVIGEETTLAAYLGGGAAAAGFTSTNGGDRSRADYYACCTAIEYGVPEADVREWLEECSHSKVGARDAARDYWSRTWSKAVADAQANSKAGDDRNRIVKMFADALEYYNLSPGHVATTTDDEGDKMSVSVQMILPDPGEGDIGEAVMEFNRGASALDGTDRQAVIGRVVLTDLRDRGEFFQTDDGRLYYFHDPEREVYRADGAGNRVLDEDFQAMVWDRYKLFAGQFSRNLGTDMKSQARRAAPTKDIYQFAHYNEADGELYVTDWGSGYYAVMPDGVEWRPNGTDVYFLTDALADEYEYLESGDRPTLPNDLPGERPLWANAGDPIMRLFGNRINYDETAALGPAQQRTQLYLHLHTLPFIDLLNARPIMAWVGEKGSGKTVLERSVGRFIYGADYSESVMPDAKDDFLAKVTNQALAFIDNYDDGEEWANDVLAAVATGAGLDKRELYTTNTLRRETPRCWLSITSRDPPFRRDDVADRTLVFRVERVDDGFVGMGDYLRQVTRFRDLLWSAYLDNLQTVVHEYEQRDTSTMSSSHRMADWAIFARIVADALGVEQVEDLLETMETERATFALENETWAAVIGEWVRSDPADAATWRSAGSLVDHLSERAEEGDRTFGVANASDLGSKLTTYHEELGELYSLEIDDSGRSNKYRFNVDDTTRTTNLDRF